MKNQPQSEIPLPFAFPSSQAGATTSMDVPLGTNSVLLQVGIHGAVSGGKLISSGKEPSQQEEDCGLAGTNPKKW